MSAASTQKNSRKPKPDFNRRVLIAELRHKLRTPLNAIIGYSEMLLEDAEETGQHDLSYDLQKIRSAGHEMLLIINDIFRLSDTRSEPLELAVKNIGAKLSYSLRTPLNSIIGYSEMLLEECEGSELCHFETDLKRIHSAGKTFLTSIKDIVNLSGVKTEDIFNTLHLNVEESTLKDLVNEICQYLDVETVKAAALQRSLLVVDDSEMTRDLLSRMLERQGHTITLAADGVKAMENLKARSFDLVLLDVLMPKMNGYQVLKQMKSDSRLRDIPVIMISALEELESVVQSIEMGADDYLLKPINPVLLSARINNCLERKRLSDLEKEQKLVCTETFGIYVAQEVRDAVLSGRIPLDGEMREVSVLFADLRNFSPLAESIPPKEVVRILNGYFIEMAPAIHEHHGTILQYVGDEIYAVFGAPLSLEDHPRQALEAALHMRQRMQDLNVKLKREGNTVLKHGIGIHSGPAVAANIGSSNRMSYNLVGDTVNLASRIQGLTKKFNTDIIISATTKANLNDDIELKRLPLTNVKGRKEPVEVFQIL